VVSISYLPLLDLLFHPQECCSQQRDTTAIALRRRDGSNTPAHKLRLVLSLGNRGTHRVLDKLGQRLTVLLHAFEFEPEIRGNTDGASCHKAVFSRTQCVRTGSFRVSPIFNTENVASSICLAARAAARSIGG
jgi:hypothetical protein